ncbi:MAG: hypothetical protein ACYC4L_07665 [Chloroflexota bacterium]
MSAGGAGGQSRSWGLAVLLVLGMFTAAVAGFLFVSQVLLPQASAFTAAPGDPKSTGAATAPVEVVVYSDFQ